MLDGFLVVLMGVVLYPDLVHQGLGMAKRFDLLQEPFHQVHAERVGTPQGLGPRHVIDEGGEVLIIGDDVLFLGEVENFRFGDVIDPFRLRAAVPLEDLQVVPYFIGRQAGDLTGLFQFLDSEFILFNRGVPAPRFPFHHRLG